jgi:hypothetical protein
MDGEQPTAPEPVATPVIETPAPVVESSTPSPTQEPTAPVVAEAPQLPPESFLGEEGDAAPVEEAPKEAAPQEPVAEQPVTYERFQVPEGLAYGDDDHAEFTKLLGEHKIPQEAGQALLDAYGPKIASMVNTAVQTERSKQHETFNTTITTWQNETKNDPVLGGPQFDTSKRMANDVLLRFAGNPQEYKQLSALMRFTGAGSHVAMMRLFNNIARAVAPPKIVQGTQPPTQKAVSGGRNSLRAHYNGQRTA